LQISGNLIVNVVVTDPLDQLDFNIRPGELRLTNASKPGRCYRFQPMKAIL
jgi:hypothetical protein